MFLSLLHVSNRGLSLVGGWCLDQMLGLCWSLCHSFLLQLWYFVYLLQDIFSTAFLHITQDMQFWWWRLPLLSMWVVFMFLYMTEFLHSSVVKMKQIEHLTFDTIYFKVDNISLSSNEVIFSYISNDGAL